MVDEAGVRDTWEETPCLSSALPGYRGPFPSWRKAWGEVLGVEPPPPIQMGPRVTPTCFTDVETEAQIANLGL